MSDAGYITDVEYTSGFYGHLAPLWLNYIAAINGFKPRPVEGEFTYCELGCGKGVTTAILAEMHPQAKFYAADMNPDHIRYAQGLQGAGKLGNVSFLQKTFAELLLMDLPPFDFVTLHGVWSWVPDSARAELRAFLKYKLKPGGLFMVSYNAMPGWAHIMPLREMMNSYVLALEGDSIARARQALGYLSFLAENKAAYFQGNPAAAEHVKFLLQQDVRYIAHEYITQHSTPYYYGQVQRAMAEIGLAYAGNMMPELNYSELMVPEPFRQFMKTAPSRQVFETHRDFIANTRFRNDLYAAQDAPRTGIANDPTLLAATRFALVQLPERIELKGSVGGVNFDLHGEEKRVKAIFRRLAEGPPASLEEIHAALGGEGALADTMTIVLQLVVTRRISPVSHQPALPRGWSDLNRALLEAAMKERANVVFVGCPALSTAMNFAIPFALALQLSRDCDTPEDASRRALGVTRAHGYRMMRLDDKGKQIEATQEEESQYYARAWEKMRDPASEEARYLRLLGYLA